VSFLLDTSAVCEWAKLRPDAGLAAWLAAVAEDQVFVSVATLAELKAAVDDLPRGGRRRRLEEWLAEEVLFRFESRILPVDAATADGWGWFMARAQMRGRPIGAVDAVIAATASRYDLSLVTRHAADFQILGVRVFNPWKG
jgi:predicted nucleic acid-binding protein